MRIVRHWYKVTTKRSSARAGRSNEPTTTTPKLLDLSIVMISLCDERGKPRDGLSRQQYQSMVILWPRPSAAAAAARRRERESMRWKSNDIFSRHKIGRLLSTWRQTDE